LNCQRIHAIPGQDFVNHISICELLREYFCQNMDMASVPHKCLSEKIRLLTNKSNGHSNGTLNGTTHSKTKGGHEEFMKVCRYEDLIGSTPLVDISRLANPKVDGIKVLAKCEFFNPGFSMKDRIVKNIFDKAEEAGLLKPGGTVVAASSGNTGAAVAMLAAMRGYKAVITTSPKCSEEKMSSIRAYGAKLIISKSGLPESHPESYMNLAVKLAEENEGWFDVNQYDNLDNPDGHFRTLGPEIWEQTVGRVTHFVAGGSTGGTISGTGRFLKEKNPDVKCILADPKGSIFYDFFISQKTVPAKKFLVEGVGKGSIPGCMDFSVIDHVIQVSDQQSFQRCHQLAKIEGLMVGGSSGLNTDAAIRLANQLEEPAVIVTVLCDLGVKYLSKVYNENWLAENNISTSE